MIDRDLYAVDVEKTYGNMMNHVEKIVIAKALEFSGGNQVAAAKLLGIHRNTLYNKIKKLNIDVGRFKR
jgi:DNA-binding protein Fis